VFAGCATRYTADKVGQMCSQNVVPVVYDLNKESGIELAYHFIIRYLPPNTGTSIVIVVERMSSKVLSSFPLNFVISISKSGNRLMSIDAICI